MVNQNRPPTLDSFMDKEMGAPNEHGPMDISSAGDALDKAQWKILTVKAVTERIKGTLSNEPGLRDIWVEGEVSNSKLHTSGHLYFSLKDEDSVLKCAMFRFHSRKLDFQVKEGMKVLVKGSVDVYLRGGYYNFVAQQIVPSGKGELFIRFQALKAKLEEEGLFTPELKKPLPVFPSNIGIVTSPTGAALRDIVKVIRRRMPVTKIILAGASVQGEGAAQSIVHALKKLEEDGRPEVIILGRGGGSMEDLWCFNEEIVARAVHECTIPIITGIGHETDFTISDFVSDVRAATPSAAAELVIPDQKDILARMLQQLAAMKDHIESGILEYRQQLDELAHGMRRQLTVDLERERQAVESIGRVLQNLSPAAVLERGYALVLDMDGNARTAVSQLNEGEEMKVMMKDGSVKVKVIKKDDKVLEKVVKK